MDKTKIEKQAVNLVNQYLLECDYLQPYLSENDKTPMWDGEIFIYNDPNNFSNNKYLGKLAVQVKGHYKGNSKITSNITHQVEVTNLKNYLNDGGIVYFVVNIYQNEKIIYYTLLTPIEIKNIIKECNDNQKNKGIQLKPIPDNNKEFPFLLMAFYKDCQLQHNNTESIPYEKFKQDYSNLICSFNTNVGSSRLFQSTYKNVYLYAKTKDDPYSNFKVVGNCRYTIQFVENVPSKIRIGDKVYYETYQRRYDDNIINISFGESFNVCIENMDKVNFKFSSKLTTLSKYLKDIEFAYYLTKTNCFYIDNIELSYYSKHSNKIEEEYKFWKKVQEVLDILHINKEFDISNLTEGEYNALGKLIKAIVEKKHINMKGENEVLKIDIGNLKMVIVITVINEKEVAIQDLFSKKFVFSYQENGKTYLGTPFDYLKETDFVYFDNIDYDNIISYYEKINDYNPVLYARANNTILSMLLAYDKQTVKNESIINACEKLIEWIIAKEPNNIVFIINKLQIIKRKRALSKEEKNYILELEEMDNKKIEGDSNFIWTIKTSCNILLEDYDRAERYLSKITMQQQETYKQFPIYNLMKQ